MIRDIFQDNFMSLLEIYDGLISEVTERNGNLEELLRAHVRGDVRVVRKVRGVREDSGVV